jgi:hypothetical protein
MNDDKDIFIFMSIKTIATTKMTSNTYSKGVPSVPRPNLLAVEAVAFGTVLVKKSISY